MTSAFHPLEPAHCLFRRDQCQAFSSPSLTVDCSTPPISQIPSTYSSFIATCRIFHAAPGPAGGSLNKSLTIRPITNPIIKINTYCHQYIAFSKIRPGPCYVENSPFATFAASLIASLNISLLPLKNIVSKYTRHPKMNIQPMCLSSHMPMTSLMMK